VLDANHIPRLPFAERPSHASTGNSPFFLLNNKLGQTNFEINYDAFCKVFAWVAVFVLPFNAAVNPMLYTLSTAPFLVKARKEVIKLHASLKHSERFGKQTFCSFFLLSSLL
jgi:hypothetical protein